ncbi:hypothetical protein ACQJBY_015183 [Aegilops geniculata]
MKNRTPSLLLPSATVRVCPTWIPPPPSHGHGCTTHPNPASLPSLSACHRPRSSLRKKHLAVLLLSATERVMAAAQAAAVVTPVVAGAAPSISPRPSSRAPAGAGGGLGWRRRPRGSAGRGLVIADAFGGQYEDGFGDVELEIMNYFTYKATQTVLYQLYEMNPPAYTWLYNYLVVNDAKEGIHFLRALSKERQDLAERVMVTRLHLYGRWIKKCNHTKMYERISNENLELMRERLMETVVWPTDDTNSSDKQD